MIKTTVFLGIFWLSGWYGIATATTVKSQAQGINLEVGIIQRLGAEYPSDRQDKIERVTISSTPGDSLKVSFPHQTSNNLPLETDRLTLKVVPQGLTQPKVVETLVLSDRSTFETAENSANSWSQLGIEVEVAQPGRWQVWAKRDVYHSPLVRRWLLHSLEANGYNDAYLDTKVLYKKPNIILEINGREYDRDQVKITSGKNLVKVNNTQDPRAARLYGGSLQLQPNAHGDFTLVNHVGLETYLRGVVPYEIGANAPFQAVAAQTIIARTYALRNLRRFEVDDYQLCATVHCQVYKGLNDANPQSDRAIAQTAGLVLTYDNELIDALYSSTTGGITAGFADSWDGAERPYLQPVLDAPQSLWNLDRYPLNKESTFRRFISLQQGFNETGISRLFRWHKTRSIQDLSQDLRQYLRKTHNPLENFSTIKSMKVQERSRSGRILTLAIDTDLGKLLLHKNEIRSALEPPLSTFFYLKPIHKDQKLTGYAFIGGGFGHGVGLSQYGSYNLAKLGWSAERILAFYYPQTEIKPLNDDIVFWSEDDHQTMSNSH